MNAGHGDPSATVRSVPLHNTFVDVTKAPDPHSNEQTRPKTDWTVNKKNGQMNTRSALNTAAFLLVVSGLLLKAMYMPGANAALILSVAMLLRTLFTFAHKDNTEAGVPNGPNRLLVGTLALLIVGFVGYLTVTRKDVQGSR